MKNKAIFVLAFLGIAVGFASAHFYAIEQKPLPPYSPPARNPYPTGLYTTGIIESIQPEGENINIYPEVSGTVVAIPTRLGAEVKKGTPLLRIEDSVQKAVVDQQKSQADAALALLEQLKAQPRPETLAVSKAQVELSQADLRTNQDQLKKLEQSYTLDSKSVSRQQLDDAENAVKVAEANLQVSQKQYDLTLAGAWIYDIRNQLHQYEALLQAHAGAASLLGKYTIRAPVEGVIISIKAAVGAFISPQGTYGTYTEGYNPVIVMRSSAANLAVRCYIDEILIPRLPPPPEMKGRMFIRGTNKSIALTFERLQPYVVPKIELSDQRTEKVDVRVLPIVFRFSPPEDMSVYPGQLVDVYLEAKE